MEKLKKLQELTGNEQLAFSQTDLEGEFDPQQHEHLMQVGVSLRAFPGLPFGSVCLSASDLAFPQPKVLHEDRLLTRPRRTTACRSLPF